MRWVVALRAAALRTKTHRSRPNLYENRLKALASPIASVPDGAAQRDLVVKTPRRRPLEGP